MKKRTLLAVLLVVPMGAALAQGESTEYSIADIIKMGESYLLPQEKLTEESKLETPSRTVTTDGVGVKTYQGQAALTGAQVGTYNRPSGNETYSGISNDSTLWRLINWLQQYFGTQAQPTTYQGQATLTGTQGGTYNRPSSSNQTDSALSNDSTLMQIARWLQQQFLGAQGEPSQPQINKQAQ